MNGNRYRKKLLKLYIWRWLFHPPTPDKKKEVFRPPPRASNGLMIKPFELGGLQMILSEPPMSNSSGGTHMDHASRPKFRIWQKLVKNAHFFIKYELFIEKKIIFCLKNFIFSEYEWAMANCSWEWNNLSNVIYFQNKVWYFRCSIIKNSSFFEIFLNTKWFSLNYCYFLLQKIW